MAKKDTALPAKQNKSGKRAPADKYPVHSIQLTLAHVGFGGNAGMGHYFYSFSPDVVTFQAGPVWIEYIFEAEVSERFEIVNVLTSDAFKQIGDVIPWPTPDGRKGRCVRMLNQNSVPTLIFFTVLVKDHNNLYNDVQLISCDPQVGNDPQIVPGAGKGKKKKA